MIADFLRQTAQLLERLDQAAIARARDLLIDAYRRGGRVITAGNGGSASTAQHFACDLAKYVIPPGACPFDVRCLTDNVSLYTAWANDAARDDVFANLMRGLLRPEDVLILISVHGGKGFSGDLVHALRYANQTGARTSRWWDSTAAFSTSESTCSILVPMESTPQTEAIHLVIEHLLMDVLQRRLGTGRRPDNGRSLRGTRRPGTSTSFWTAFRPKTASAKYAPCWNAAGGRPPMRPTCSPVWSVSCGIAAAIGDDAYGRRSHRRVSRRGGRRQPAGTEPRSSYAGLGHPGQSTETGVG